MSRPVLNRLVFAGEAIVDLLMWVPALPERGGDMLADAAAIEVGGGFNVMAAAARQGLPVVYAGVVPDIFRSGIQVVVEGRFDQGGTFQADRLTAKCPSKYQTAGELGAPASPRVPAAAS